MVKEYSPNELVEIFRTQVRKSKIELAKFNLVVIGQTGVGKSTIINGVFQKSLAPAAVGEPLTKVIAPYTENDCPITIWDTPGLMYSEGLMSLFDGTNSVKRKVAKLINKGRKSSNVNEHIHMVWYCITPPRIQKIEEKWISELDLQQVPVIVVVNQELNLTESIFQSELRKKIPPTCKIVPLPADKEFAGANPANNPIFKTPELKTLVQKSFELVPEIARRTFVASQFADVDLKGSEALKYITGFAAASGFVSGVNPIPGVEALILVETQIMMFARISTIFGLELEEEFIIQLTNVIFGLNGMASATTLVSNLIKMIPGVSTLTGGTVSAATAGVITTTVGIAYTETLKYYLKAQIRGEVIPLNHLIQIFTEILTSHNQPPAFQPA